MLEPGPDWWCMSFSVLFKFSDEHDMEPSDFTGKCSLRRGMAIKLVYSPATGGPLARVNEIKNHFQPIADGLCSSGTQVKITVITELTNAP